MTDFFRSETKSKAGSLTAAIVRRLPAERRQQQTKLAARAETVRLRILDRLARQLQAVVEDTTIPAEYKIVYSNAERQVGVVPRGDGYAVYLSPDLWQRLRLYEYGSASLNIRPHQAWRGVIRQIKQELSRP